MLRFPKFQGEAGMADYSFISSFLSTVEGPCQTTGYIPCHIRTGGTANYKGGPKPERYQAMGASGVTIATGCDLGQTSESLLCEYGLDPLIAGIFGPYFGKKRDAAIEILHRYPLVISPAAASQTDQAVHRGYLDRFVRPAFESDSGHSFDAIPREAQAAIMSICFQKGIGGTRRDAPKTWKLLCALDWSGAANELIYGFRQYASRRGAEGQLLKRIGTD